MLSSDASRERMMQRIIIVGGLLLLFFLVAAGMYVFWDSTDILADIVKPVPVKAEDREVAWLHPATNAPVWERFVSGIVDLAKSDSSMETDLTGAHPAASVKPPAVGIKRKDSQGWIWIRWYKLSAERPTSIWVNALLKRNPAPIVFVGGGSTDRARDLTIALNAHPWKSLSDRPPLIITTATSDTVTTPSGESKDLMQIYPERSVRMAFTNSQMASAVMSFLDNLRQNTAYLAPERNPELSEEENAENSSKGLLPVLSCWDDDSYSRDLVRCFAQMLTPATEERTFLRSDIGHGVGGMDTPNRLEVAAIEKIRSGLGTSEHRFRTKMLILPGSAVPARRFLKTLYRLNPTEVQSWFVATADSIDWNSVFRDRRITWPIDEVPFKLAFFMHRNPVDEEVGFPSIIHDALPKNALTGTDERLLYRDVGSVLMQSLYSQQQLRTRPEEVMASLAQAVDTQGKRLFNDSGNRPGEEGEYIGLLLPQFDGIIIRPYSLLEVWTRQTSPDAAATSPWRLVRTLTLSYSPSSPVNAGVKP